MNWEEWKGALKTAFPRSTDYVNRLEEMLARTKIDSETMTKYYHAKLSLLKKCNIDGEEAISCIIRGLPVELRANAKAYQCYKPENLYYGYLSSLENYKQPPETKNAMQKFTWRRGEFGSNNNNTTTAFEASSTSTFKQQDLPKICYACRKPGHEARYCVTSPQRCEVCQRFGHAAATCWFAAGSSQQQLSKVGNIMFVTYNVYNVYKYTKKLLVNECELLAYYIDTGSKFNVFTVAKAEHLKLKVYLSTVFDERIWWCLCEITGCDFNRYID